MTNLTTDAAAYVAALAETIRGRSVPMAVVDDAGRYDGLGAITADDQPQRRFGVRDMRHVALYRLMPVAYNPAAQSIVDGARAWLEANPA